MHHICFVKKSIYKEAKHNKNARGEYTPAACARTTLPSCVLLPPPSAAAAEPELEDEISAAWTEGTASTTAAATGEAAAD